ncbi:MAG: hypothetical protein RIR51_1069 [Bacteroidota bacterium]
MNILITGTTGMVGKGVLLEALIDERISHIKLINRKSIGIVHPKIKEIIHEDFQNISSIEDQLNEIDACIFCMGVSSVGLKEAEFNKLTFDIVKEFADKLYELNPNSQFSYISGSGTDSSEKGKLMWARIKGKTENYILNKGFKSSFAFRPGIIIPEKGIQSKTKIYNAAYIILRPFFPLFKLSKNVTTTTKLGKAMLNIIFKQPGDNHFENSRINELAEFK